MPTNKEPQVLTWYTEDEAQELIDTEVQQSPQGISVWGDQSNMTNGTVVSAENDVNNDGERVPVVTVRWANGDAYTYWSGEIQSMKPKNPPVRQGLLDLWPADEQLEALTWRTAEEMAGLVGTQVRLSQTALADFGDQSDGGRGTIVTADQNKWVSVRWERNLRTYSYRSGDLIRATGGK